MFDVGFFELMLIGVVALLVVGPERLPKLARTAGMWLGKGKQMINSVKADIAQEIKADELKKILEKQEQLNPVHEIMEDTRKTLNDIGQDTRSSLDSAAEGLSDTKNKTPTDTEKT
jgi:sec-independent protein translocase protein TatB